MNKSELIADNNNWVKEKQDHSMPLYLNKKQNKQLVKEALRTQYHSTDEQ